MALKLDELLIKKKEPVQILDLSKSIANSKEELKKLLEKVPEFKIKMEKVRPEDAKIRDRIFPFNTTKKDLKPKVFPFINPVPSEMKCLRLDDLVSVGIQWRMLTSIRPKNRLDEEYYSKLIELGKLQAASREKEKKTPLTMYIRKIKTRSGHLETKFISCRECGEEFCKTETCNVLSYDSYERTVNPSMEAELTAQDVALNAEQKKRKRKKSLIPSKNADSKSRKRKPVKLKMSTRTASLKESKTSTAHVGQIQKSSLVVNKIRKLPKYNARNSNASNGSMKTIAGEKVADSAAKKSSNVGKSKLKQRVVKSKPINKRKK